MLHKLDIGQFKDGLRRYFKGSDSLGGQPLPEVNKALIEDAPRVVRLTIWGVILFFVFLIVWASVAPIDEVTRGEGKAIPSSKVQKIQNLEGGIVAEIFAKEGQIVEVGQPLLRLDETRFASNVGETEADRLAMALRVERLSAEVQDSPLKIDEELRKAAPSQAASEESLYQSRRQQLQDEIGGLQQQLVQRQQELREYSSKRAQYANSLELLRKEIGMSEPLVATGAISQVEVLRLRRAEVENRGQLDSTALAIPRAEAAIREVQSKIEETRGKFRSEALTQLNEARTELNKATATSKALDDRVHRTLVAIEQPGLGQEPRAIPQPAHGHVLLRHPLQPLGQLRERAQHRAQAATHHQQVQAFPGVLLATARQYLKQRGSRCINDAVAGPVNDRSDWERHSSLHPHTPQRLLSVANCRIQDVNVCHSSTY